MHLDENLLLFEVLLQIRILVVRFFCLLVDLRKRGQFVLLVHIILPHLHKQVVSELEINRVVILQKLLSLRLHPSLSLGIGEFLDF